MHTRETIRDPFQPDLLACIQSRYMRCALNHCVLDLALWVQAACSFNCSCRDGVIDGWIAGTLQNQHGTRDWMSARGGQVHIGWNVPAVYPVWSKPFLGVGKELEFSAIAGSEFLGKVVELNTMLGEHVARRELWKDGLESLDDEFGKYQTIRIGQHLRGDVGDWASGDCAQVALSRSHVLSFCCSPGYASALRVPHCDKVLG
jgi:hypothetical protein